MTWTYNPAQVGTTTFMQVRLLIGDTLPKDPQLQDEEITFLLGQRNSIYGTAADCCRAIASNLSRQADSVQGELRTLYSSRAKAYAVRAAQYENFAVARSGALPYAGGISITDKQQQVEDADRVPPQFNVGMDDDFIPVSPDDNETVEPPPVA